MCSSCLISDSVSNLSRSVFYSSSCAFSFFMYSSLTAIVLSPSSKLLAGRPFYGSVSLNPYWPRQNRILLPPFPMHRKRRYKHRRPLFLYPPRHQQNYFSCHHTIRPVVCAAFEAISGQFGIFSCSRIHIIPVVIDTCFQRIDTTIQLV